MKYFLRVIAFCITALLAACGGGGGSSGANPNQPTLTSTAGDTQILPAGSFKEFSIVGGVPPYQATSSEPAIAVGSISGSKLTIGAIAGGKAIIRVFDYKGTAVSTEVTVGSSVPLYTTAPTPLKIGVGVTRTFTIGGGSPPYTVEGGNASVAVVSQIDATHWTVTGKALGGSDFVKVRDAAGATVLIELSTAAPELRITPTDLTMPVGYEAEVVVSGGQPPYVPAGNIPAAVSVSPSTSQDGKFKIRGNLAPATLDVTFADSAGQFVKVKVTTNTATVNFRISPSPIFVNETDTDAVTFSMYGFYGDSGTGPANGTVCIYVSDPSYMTLDSSRKQCDSYSSTSRTFQLGTGTRGNRCVSANKELAIQAIDSMGQTATASVTILDVGTSCGSGTGSGGLTLSSTVVTVQNGTNATILISGGTGSYVATTSDATVATATTAGNVLTVTGGAKGGRSVATITVVDVGNPGQTATLTVTNDGP